MAEPVRAAVGVLCDGASYGTIMIIGGLGMDVHAAVYRALLSRTSQLTASARWACGRCWRLDARSAVKH